MTSATYQINVFFVKQVCGEVPLIVRHCFASKKDSVKVFKIYSRIRWDDGYK